MDGLKQQTCIFSQFWRLGVYNEGVSKTLVLLKALKPCGCSISVSTSVIMWHSPPCMCLYVSKCPSSYKTISYIGLRTHSNLVWSHRHLSTSSKTLFQIKSHASVLGMRTETYLSGNIIQSITVPKAKRSFQTRWIRECKPHRILRDFYPVWIETLPWYDWVCLLLWPIE